MGSQRRLGARASLATSGGLKVNGSLATGWFREIQDGGQLVLENRWVYIGQEKDLVKLVVPKKQGRMRVGYVSRPGGMAGPEEAKRGYVVTLT